MGVISARSGGFMDAKRNAAERAVDYIHDGMIVGLGTGSTAYWAIQKLGSRVQEGLNIKAIATSIQSEELAKKLGIPIITFSEINEIDITIDGADEVIIGHVAEILMLWENYDYE